jgi:hypothetical protein
MLRDRLQRMKLARLFLHAAVSQAITILAQSLIALFLDLFGESRLSELAGSVS